MMASTIDLTGDDDYARPVKETNLSEVNVKLRSLDGELDRDILFSERTGFLSIEIGRASKNVTRDMYALTGNAWVPSPVMSRHHAIMYIEPSSGPVVYIKDLESTHGTRVNGERLAPHKKIRLLTGDIVTLGSTVRAGPNEFYAKVFEVHCAWKGSGSTPIVLTPSPSTEQSSGARTYSVPSPGPSDDELDEELEINDAPANAVVDNNKNYKQSVTPGEAHHNIQDQQKNMEQVHTAEKPPAHISLDNSPAVSPDISDDDSPESLPIQKSQPGAAKSYLEEPLSTSSHLDTAQETPGLLVNDNVPAPHRGADLHSPVEARSPSFSPVSPTYSPQSPQMSVPSQEYIAIADDTLAADEWNDSEDDDIDIFDEYDNMRAAVYPEPSDVSSDSEQVSNVSDAGDSNSLRSQECSIISPTAPQNNTDEAGKQFAQVRSFFGGDVMEKSVKPHRDPSPSDAALARRSFGRQLSAEYHTSSQPHDEGLHAPQDSAELSAGIQPTPVEQQAQTMYEAPAYAFDAMNHGQPNPWQKDESDPFCADVPRNYTQGPFAMLTNASGVEAAQSRQYSTAQSQGIPQTHDPTTWSYYGGDQLVDMELGYAPSFSESIDSPRWGIRPIQQSSQGNFLSDGDPSKQTTETFHPTPQNPSRLRISHLVNDAPESFGRIDRSLLKRKAAMIEDEDDSEGECKSESERDIAEASVGTGQRLQLPEATQSATKDRVMSVETDIMEKISKDTVDVAPATIADMGSQSRTDSNAQKESHSGSSTTLRTGQIVEPFSTLDSVIPHTIPTVRERGQPAQKRAKTERATQAIDQHQTTMPRTLTDRVIRGRSWLRKAARYAFVGVAGGVAGAAVTVAALIATVPEDIRREAIHEY